MASDRLAELLRSTSELTDEEINRMTESDAWKLIHAGAPEPEKKSADARDYEGLR